MPLGGTRVTTPLMSLTLEASFSHFEAGLANFGTLATEATLAEGEGRREQVEGMKSSPLDKLSRSNAGVIEVS